MFECVNVKFPLYVYYGRSRICEFAGLNGCLIAAHSKMYMVQFQCFMKIVVKIFIYQH